MLRVADNSAIESYSYISKVLENYRRYEIGISYEVTPAFDVLRDIYITLIRAPNGLPLSAILLDKNFTLKLKVWHYTQVPSRNFINPVDGVDYKVFPGQYLFPKSNRNKFAPLWGNGFDYEPYKPGYAQPRDEIALSSRKGTYKIELRINNPHSQIAEAQLYVERVGGASGSAYNGPLNWKFNNIGQLDIGCVYSNKTAYDLTFDNISINGDVPDTNWYFIKDYQGFHTDIPDVDGSWIGAGEVDDSQTYSEPTSLKNLVRYDYSKFLPGSTNFWGSDSTFDDLKNIYFNTDIYWGSKQTFDELKDRHFIPFTTDTHHPKGLKWYLP